MASNIQELLPAHEGLLPKWLLLMSVVSMGMSVSNYIGTAAAEKVYTGSEGTIKDKNVNPVNPLSARTFGTWTLISSIVRFYGAYYIDNPVVYQLTLWTFAVAFGHFGLEWFKFGTARWSKGFASPVFVATGSLIWMTSQWSHYLG